MQEKNGEARGVAKTRRRLRQALARLLDEKPLHELTVRELTAAAGVSRGTFYFHYPDVDALLEEMEQEHLAQLKTLLDALLPDLEGHGVPQALEALFRYLDANDDICRALYGPYADPAFTVRVKALLAEHCLGRMTAGGGNDRQRYLMEFAVHGCFGTIQAWQAAGRDRPPERMAAIVWQGIRAVKHQF